MSVCNLAYIKRSFLSAFPPACNLDTDRKNKKYSKTKNVVEPHPNDLFFSTFIHARHNSVIDETFACPKGPMIDDCFLDEVRTNKSIPSSDPFFDIYIQSVV